MTSMFESTKHETNKYFFFQYAHGKLKTIVNKLMGVSRVSGLLFAAILASETVLVTEITSSEYRSVFCYSTSFMLNSLTFSFWFIQFFIALLRWHIYILIFLHISVSYAFVKYPTEVHNQFPTNQDKDALFRKLTWSGPSLSHHSQHCCLPVAGHSIPWSPGHPLGRHNRVVLPRCVVEKIRETYPERNADNYTGFIEPISEQEAWFDWPGVIFAL